MKSIASDVFDYRDAIDRRALAHACENQPDLRTRLENAAQARGCTTADLLWDESEYVIESVFADITPTMTDGRPIAQSDPTCIYPESADRTVSYPIPRKESSLTRVRAYLDQPVLVSRRASLFLVVWYMLVGSMLSQFCCSNTQVPQQTARSLPDRDQE